MKALAFLLLMTTGATAQSVCGQLDNVVKALSEKYGELPNGPLGIVHGAMMRILVNERTGTFTILIVRPDGMACVSIAGEGWQPGDPPGKPEKAL